jgi:hypothetical protein
MSSKITYVRKTSAERESEIEKALAIRAMNNGQPATMRELARCTGVSASTFMMNRLWKMVDDGRLIANPEPYGSGVTQTRWLFQVPAHRLPTVLGDVYEVRS